MKQGLKAILGLVLFWGIVAGPLCLGAHPAIEGSKSPGVHESGGRDVGKKGLSPSLQTVRDQLNQMASQPDSPIDLLQAVELIERLEGRATESAKIPGILRSFQKDLAKRFSGRKNPQEKIHKLADYLYHDQKFYSSPQLFDLKVTYLSEVLTHKQGNCLSLSLLWMLLSEDVGLPLFPVVAPEHIFLRWKGPPEGPLNVETVSFKGGQGRVLDPGSLIEDKAYQQAFSIPKAAIQKGVYLKTLPRRAILSAYLNNLGAIHLSQALENTTFKLFRERTLYAEELLTLALRFDPGSFTVLTNLATLSLLWKHDVPSAERFLDKARQQWNDTKTWMLKGVLERRQHNEEKALKAFQKVEKESTDPAERYRDQKERALTYLVFHRVEKAKLLLDKLAERYRDDPDLAALRAWEKIQEGHWAGASRELTMYLEHFSALIEDGDLYALLVLIEGRLKHPIQMKTYFSLLEKHPYWLSDMIPVLLPSIKKYGGEKFFHPLWQIYAAPWERVSDSSTK